MRHGVSILVHRFDYKGRHYPGALTPMRSPGEGPGWFLYGRSLDEYAPKGIIKIVARPDVEARSHPHYSMRVRRGWLTKRDAIDAAREIASDYLLKIGWLADDRPPDYII